MLSVAIMQSVVMLRAPIVLSVIYTESCNCDHYGEHCDKAQYVKYLYAECHCAEFSNYA